MKEIIKGSDINLQFLPFKWTVSFSLGNRLSAFRLIVISVISSHPLKFGDNLYITIWWKHFCTVVKCSSALLLERQYEILQNETTAYGTHLLWMDI